MIFIVLVIYVAIIILGYHYTYIICIYIYIVFYDCLLVKLCKTTTLQHPRLRGPEGGDFSSGHPFLVVARSQPDVGDG